MVDELLMEVKIFMLLNLMQTMAKFNGLQMPEVLEQMKQKELFVMQKTIFIYVVILREL